MKKLCGQAVPFLKIRKRVGLKYIVLYGFYPHRASELFLKFPKYISAFGSTLVFDKEIKPEEPSFIKKMAFEMVLEILNSPLDTENIKTTQKYFIVNLTNNEVWDEDNIRMIQKLLRNINPEIEYLSYGERRKRR